MTSSGGSDVRTLYRRAQDTFGARVHGVADDQWTSATPCSDWDVRTLVNHVLSEVRWAVPLFAGRTVADVGDRFAGDLLGDDPLAGGTRRHTMRWTRSTPRVSNTLEPRHNIARKAGGMNSNVCGDEGRTRQTSAVRAAVFEGGQACHRAGSQYPFLSGTSPETEPAR